MRVDKVLTKRALITPHRHALIYRDRKFTYLELEQRTNRLSQALLSKEVKKGDRIALLMHNTSQFVELFFACARIGAIVVPLNVRLAPPEFDYIIRDCEVSALIYGDDFEETVTQLETSANLLFKVSTADDPGSASLSYEDFIGDMEAVNPGIEVSENDLMAIMYTSGTTGYPKGAMLSHGNVYSAAINLMIGIDYLYPDTSLIIVPLFHSGGNTPMLGQFIRGITTVLMHKFDPVETLRLIDRYKVKLIMGVSSIMSMLLEVKDAEKFNLDSWKTALLPGSPLPHSLIKEVYSRFGVLCQNLWGMTELGGPGSIMNIEDILEKPECAGVPYFEVDIRVVDVYGNDQPSGEPGEIIAKGPNIMQGYWKQEKATAEVLVDGWLHSGDIGYFDDENYLYIIDRKKDMILSGGENVYPMEIENVIRDIPGVAETSVIGIADVKWGEVPKAFVVPIPGKELQIQEIMDYCKSRLAGYKIPRDIQIVDDLPRNASGKVLKKVLRNYKA